MTQRLRSTRAVIVTKGLAPWKVHRVLAYIEENLGEPLRNKDLAVVAELSEFHFSNAFRDSVGQTPHEYLIRRRIERAQGFMLSTAAPLSEIAAECGLADQAHFTRLFRRAVGETPAAWRRARSNLAGGFNSTSHSTASDTVHQSGVLPQKLTFVAPASASNRSNRRSDCTSVLSGARVARSDLTACLPAESPNAKH